MHAPNQPPPMLELAAGEFPLDEYRLRAAGREWSILHTGAIMTLDDEQRFFSELRNRVPYGVALWPAAIALAHDVASRANSFNGRRVLELGAGTGLPGIIAASFGADVVQTDTDAAVLSVCRSNGQRNRAATITYRQVDWSSLDESARYDWILGSDILYDDAMHPFLRLIFETQLAPGGRVLLADPLRDVSFGLLETLEANGWTISMSKWSVGEAETPRPIGVFELARDAKR